MSAEIEENLSHIDRVDVDCSAKGNVFHRENVSDSGVNFPDSCATTLPTSASFDASPVKVSESVSNVEENNIDDQASDQGSNLSLSCPTSISTDNTDAIENFLNFDEISPTKKTLKSDELHKDASITDSACEISDDVDKSISNSYANFPSNQTKVSDTEPDAKCNITNSELDYKISKNLTSSTMSLDEQNVTSNLTNIMCKSPYSKSAENISIITNIESNLNSSASKLDTEKILSDFSSQKNKVSATQKLLDDRETHKPSLQLQHTSDSRYGRLPININTQDLGNIVKNVHGIFSSVSGSLKHAYTHRNVQKPVKTIPRPVPNGKVMGDIFEDDSIENSVSNTPKEIEVPKVEIKTVEESVAATEETKVPDSNVDDPKLEVLKLQIESLEKVVADQRKENTGLRERVKQQVDELQGKDQTFRELEVKLDMMGKRVDQAEREKDAAVMRYASVECAAIEAKRAAEKAAAAERAAVAEMELLNGKLKSAHAEKQRICQLYDDKCHELQNSEREVAKVREEARELEGRLKWTQSKLRMEMDAYKDSAEKVEKLTQQVTELEAAKESAIANATDSARAKQLETELKESQAALILCRHEKEHLERQLASTSAQLDTCKRERDSATSELEKATMEVERLKISNLQLEEEAAELAALRAQAALADTLSAQLERESQRAASAEQALSLERARAETCARREAAALQHAAALTAHHVASAAQGGRAEDKARALSLDNASLREKIESLESEVSRLRAAVEDESDKRNKENRVLARKVAELTEEASEANKKLQWEKGENDVLKKKHNSAIKEMNRELQRALKRCEQLEAKLPPQDAASTRTGSVSSLSSGESALAEDKQNGHADVPHIQVREPDRQALIERIVSLQRAAARRGERCEFLEEHSRQLTAELRNKARLLRHLLSNAPAGALAPQQTDTHKKEIARLGGGAMAALWGGDPAGMTLQLSLEMNKRLQAVLEDALLKNITLKENMDTLGEEIARLKGQPSASTDSK